MPDWIEKGHFSNSYFDNYQPPSIPKIVDKLGEKTWIRCTMNPESIWYWDIKGKVWRPDGEAYVISWIGENYPFLPKKLYLELKFAIQKYNMIPHDKFRPNPLFLQFQDKELDLEHLVDHGVVEVEHYIKHRLATELDLKSAGPPKEFLQCLRNALPDGIELYRALQAFATILLIRTMRIEKAFFFLGSGGNGKSTIMKAVENIFENYISHVDLADLVQDRFAASQLVDKLANVYADIQTLKFKDLAIFKAISSGDTISVNAKYQDRRDETIKVVQFYSANKMPDIENANPGFYRRVFPILFDQVIENPDPYIDDKLNTPEEHKRILALLVRIARTTKRFGFLYERSQQEIIDIIAEKASPLKQMLSDTDYILTRPEYRIEHGRLFAIYRKFCKDKKYSPKPQGGFTREMHDMGFETIKSNSVRYFTGVGFPSKTDNNKGPQQQIIS